jgi:hypothetical protein
MELIECPECGNAASLDATFCPQCGFAIKKEPGRPPQASRGLPVIPITLLDVTRSIVGRLLLGAGVVWTGVEFDAPPAVILGLIACGSAVPLYLKARKAYRLGSLVGHRELEAAVRKQLAAARDETQREASTIEHNTGRIAELEERLDFMERLLARGRERP